MFLEVNLTKSSEMPLYKGKAGGEVCLRYLTCQIPVVYRCFERFSEVSAKNEIILKLLS